MPVIAVNLTEKVFSEIARLVAVGTYETPAQFLQTAAFNQLALESGATPDSLMGGDQRNPTGPSWDPPWSRQIQSPTASAMSYLRLACPGRGTWRASTASSRRPSRESRGPAPSTPARSCNTALLLSTADASPSQIGVAPSL